MKDYFAFISKMQVTAVTQGKTDVKGLVEPNSDKYNSIVFCSNKAGIEGNGQNAMLPAVKREVPSLIVMKDAQTSVIPMVPIVTHNFEQFGYFYEERCGIYQHEANYSRLEAELQAYQETLKDFLTQIYPAILAEFEKIIFQPFLH